MYNFNKRLEKNRVGKTRRNKKVSKFLPAFLVLIITAVSLTVLFKTTGLSKILNLIFKDPTYTSENSYVQATVYEGPDSNDFAYFYVDYYYHDFTNKEFLVNWNLALNNRSADFKNQDFIIMIDQHKADNRTYFRDFLRNFIQKVLGDETLNNRVVIKYTSGHGPSQNDYSNDLTALREAIDRYYEFSPNFSNGYAQALKFLDEHNPVSGRTTQIIYVTDDTGSYDKYKPFYDLIKSRYSNVPIHFGLGGTTSTPFPPYLRESWDIADKVYYYYGWELHNQMYYGIGFYDAYTDVVITMKLSEYVDLVDYNNNTGNSDAVEVYEEGGSKYVRLSFDEFDMYQGQHSNLQTLLKLKENVPDFVPLNGTIKIDFKTADGITRHKTIDEALVVANHFTVEVDPNAPSGCDVETPPPRTYELGTQAYYPEKPYCEGWEFAGWINDGYFTTIIDLGEDVFTGKGDILFTGTWTKVTLTKKAS